MVTLRPSASALLLGAALCALSCGSKGIVDQVCPTSPQRMASSSAMTAAEFCEVYMQTCTGSKAPPGSYITQAECEAAFTGLSFDSTRECRSYHLCNSAAYDSGNGLLHCGHAVGINGCADTGP
jgi:hypothetical protein